MYSHIVVPVDGSAIARQAQQLGADLSARIGAQLVVVTSADVRAPASVEPLKQAAMDMSTGHTHVRLDAFADPTAAIRAAVDARPDCLVVLGTHARSGVDLILRGSVSETVLAEVSAPVLLVGPACTLADSLDIKRLLVCVDGSETSAAAVPIAAHWAAHLDLACTLLYISRGGAFPGMDALADLLGRSAPAVDTVTVTGPAPAEGILDMLARDRTAIPVLGSHGRRGAKLALAGSTVIEVAKASPAPVLVMRAGAVRPPTAGETDPPDPVR